MSENPKTFEEIEAELLSIIESDTSVDNKLSAALKLEKAREEHALANGETYEMKMLEILEGEFREFDKNEAEEFFKNPEKFPASIQRKYTGTTLNEWKPTESFEGDCPEGFEVIENTLSNPFTLKPYTVKMLQPLPEVTVEERIQTLKQKVVNRTATAEEKEELKLLTL